MRHASAINNKYARNHTEYVITYHVSSLIQILNMAIESRARDLVVKV